MLEVEELSKEFRMHVRGGVKLLSFDGVSFRVGRGEFLGLTGPSGIGKSSLLKCIYRTYLPTGGEIWYAGADGTRVDLARADEHEVLKLRQSEIGYISQFFHVIPRVSAVDILSGALTGKGCDAAEGRERSEYLLSRVGIPASLWKMYPSTFSGGEKQRLNIVHAIISRPRLLLLDEPTASLDPDTKKEVISLISELKREGTAMVGVFHDYDSMKKLADLQYDLSAKQSRALEKAPEKGGTWFA